MNVRLSCSGPVNGTLALPGSKSETNRFLIAAYASRRSMRIGNASLCDDTTNLVKTLTRLGCRIRVKGRAISISCSGRLRDSASVDIGGAGTSARFLTAVLAARGGTYILDGNEQIRRRPISDLVDALVPLGVRVTYMGIAGHLPLKITGSGFKGGCARVRADISSQFVSALKLAALACVNEFKVETTGKVVSASYIRMTEEVIQKCKLKSVECEADAAAANYFFGLAAVTGGAVTVTNLGRDTIQGEYGMTRALEKMGCKVADGASSTTVGGRVLKGCSVDLSDSTDSVMTLCCVAPFAGTTTEISGVSNLRFKETNRLDKIREKLGNLGVKTEVGERRIRVHPGFGRTRAAIRCDNDHRIAMSFSIPAAAFGTISLNGAECVRKSFPGFFPALGAVGVSVL